MSASPAAPAAASAAAAQGDAARAEHAWQAVRGIDTIQFTPVPAPPPETPYVPPRWLEAILRVLGRGLEWINAHLFEPFGLALAKSGQALLVGLIVVGVAALGWLAWTLIAPWWQARRGRVAQAAPEWNPVRQAALALLEDADALAAQGRFAEAVHLLLQRSVADIAAARPDWLSPSSTAREIALLPAMPATARQAFATMAEEVERARYALRAPGLGEWQRARGAYAAFALEPIGATA